LTESQQVQVQQDEMSVNHALLAKLHACWQTSLNNSFKNESAAAIALKRVQRGEDEYDLLFSPMQKRSILLAAAAAPKVSVAPTPIPLKLHYYSEKIISFQS